MGIDAGSGNINISPSVCLQDKCIRRETILFCHKQGKQHIFFRLHDKNRNSIAALFARWSKGSMMGHPFIAVSTPKSVVWVLVPSLQCFPQALIAG